jgi:Protein of unknown function (DUF3138)
MRTLHITALALALAAAFPAAAQSNADILKELEALKAKVGELESKLKAQAEKKPEWGMTPDQARELNRVTVKTEAMEDSRDAGGLKLLKISGYADPTYIYNRNQGRAGFQFLNNVADDGYNYDNSYFGAISLDFQKETDSGTKWRLTLVPNRGTDSVIGNGGIVHEASVSVPLTDLQTRFIAGHIPDWSGYEYLQPTLNKLITHNLLFDFTLPTSYTGAGMEVTSGKWIMKGVLANMNASRNGQGEKAPVVAYRVDYSRGEFQGFGFAGVHGKAANFSENMVDSVTGDVIGQRNSRLDLFEFDAYFIRGDWTVQGQVSLGRQKGASITPFEAAIDRARERPTVITEDPASGRLRDSSWWGLSALAAYKFNPRLEGIVRADYLNNKKNGGGLLGYTAADDRNGIGPDPSGDPNVGANRTALSFGVSYLFDQNTTLKAEYRLDRANLPVFLVVKDGTYRKSNNLLGASVLVAF